MSEERDDDDPFERQDEDEEYEEPQADSTVDRREQKKRKDKAKQQQEEERNFWRGCLATEIGRRCLWQVLERAQIYGERFATGPNGFPNADATNYYRGQRDYGINLLRSWQKHDLAGVMAMLKEHDPELAEPVKRKKKRAGRDV